MVGLNGSPSEISKNRTVEEQLTTLSIPNIEGIIDDIAGCDD